MSNARRILQKMREEKARRLTEVSFADCTEVRNIGLYLADMKYSTVEDVIQAVSSEFSLSPDKAEDRILQYLYLLEAPKSQIAGRARHESIEFYSGIPLEELSNESRYSEGEIKRSTRLFLAQCEEKAPRPIRFRTQFPPMEYIREDYNQSMIDSLSDIDFSFFENLDTPDVDEHDYPFFWLKYLPFRVYEGVYEAYNEHGEATAREVLALALEDSEVDSFVSDTELFRGDREQLFYDALDAYREEKYSLCVPLALSQIDGLVIELATQLEIWELNDSVTGVDIMRKSTTEQSDKYIEEVDEFLSEDYRRRMGSATRRAKILHGIDTEFIRDREFATETIWFWMAIFCLVDQIKSRNAITDERLLEFLAVSRSQSIDEVANRFDSHALHVKSRLDNLAAEGLVTQEGERYSITDKGEEHLLNKQPEFVIE